jgi:hypothetical protein
MDIQEWLFRECGIALDASFLEPGWDMDNEIVNKTSYRGEHSPRCWVNQVESILRPRPFWQYSFYKPLF